MHYQPFDSIRITERGLWVQTRQRVGVLEEPTKVLVPWDCLDTEECAEIMRWLDRRARRDLIERWSDEPIPLDWS